MKLLRRKAFPGKDYDFVTFFDCLHDMGDPAGASAHVHSRLKKDGTWMIVEPFAGDKLEDNLNPSAARFTELHAFVYASVAVPGGGIGAGRASGRETMKEVVTSGGFTRFRRATQTPFNLVFEARP